MLADRFDPRPDPLSADPAGWVASKEGFLWSVQRQIIESVRDNRYTAVPSCFDAGKSFLASATLAWWIATHPLRQAFGVSTAPVDVQVKAILWREMQRRHEDWGLDGRITGDAQWKIGQHLVAYGRKPADYNPAAFQGIHDKYVLVVIDEAAGIPEALYNAVDGLVTNEYSRVLAIGNPDDPNSHFAKICKPGSGWNVIRISAFDTPNLTGEDVPEWLRPLLVSQTWVDERKRRWGVTSPMYVSKVLGEFPALSKDALIEPGWILKAQLRTVEPDPVDAIYGVDVARFGMDKTQIYLRQGNVVRHVYEGAKTATTTTTGVVVSLIEGHFARPPANVDDDGIGGAVTDMLNEQGFDVRPLHNGGSPSDPKFGNARSEWYWTLREAFAGYSGTGDDGAIDIDAADEDLAAQLGELRYKQDSRGRIWIETKDEMRKRGVPSPDRADAACYAWVDTGSWLSVIETADVEDPGTITGDVLAKDW